MTALVLAALAGVLIGLSLGAVGAGGSILAVPALVLLGQGSATATTGSLVVVGVTATTGAVAAHRAGTALLGRGLAFGGLAVAGAVVGATWSARVDEQVLLLAFAAVMVVAAAMMLRGRCVDCPADERVRPARLLLAASLTGLLTGFLGVGGGFLVVPALVLALGLDVRRAAGTSLVVIALTSAVALAARAGTGLHPDWPTVLAMTAAAVLAARAGLALAGRLDPNHLTRAFAALVVAVAAGTALHALT